MRKTVAEDLLQAVEGVYQKLQSFADVSPRACDSASKIYVLGRGLGMDEIGEGD